MANMMGSVKSWLMLGGAGSLSALYFSRNIRPSQLTGWRAFAIALALLNLKSLPFAWHFRLLYGLLRHVAFPGKPPPKEMLPQLLFQPIITSSRAPLMEIDYNMHKSNSTYFSDLDISRVHLIACLMKLGLHRGREAIVAEKDGAFGIMLGAVTCSFKREIKPYEAYEIWTQVLAWDQKWLYLQSHIVRPGHRPKAWTLQPWRKDVAGEKQRERFKEKPAYDGVIASSVAKYVFKQGRKTIAPERMFELSGMLPEGRGHVWQSAEGPMPYNAQIAMSEPEMWDAERFEQERLHGLRTAERVDDLAKLNYGHNPGARPALGRY